MSFLILCLLCIVQGLTEFLPISSSGHLTLIEQVFNVQTDMILLNLFLHLASLVAVVIFYQKIILNILKRPFQPLTIKLLISTIFSVLLAFLYKALDINKYVFQIYGFCFLITAIVLFICHKFQKEAVLIKKAEPTYKDSIIVGIIQGLAVIPGLSRSGTTIASLIFLKNDETKSAEYSFLLSIPIILGGFILEILEIEDFSLILSQVDLWQYIFAFFLTFIVAMLSLKFTVKMLKNQKFIYFSAYLIIIFIIVSVINFI